MDNMIKKFNEELKYLFPQSNLEVVLLETSLSESKGMSGCLLLVLRTTMSGTVSPLWQRFIDT